MIDDCPDVVSPMNVSEQQYDLCPHCHSPFEIVCVKFGFGCPAMIASCPNCGLACPDEWGPANTKTLDHREKSARIDRGIRQRKASMLDQLNLRFKYVLAFLIGAVITAAALRHGSHVYGGFSREEIRTGALIAIPFVGLALIFFRRKRRE
jgi:hypothetical protein